VARRRLNEKSSPQDAFVKWFAGNCQLSAYALRAKPTYDDVGVPGKAPMMGAA